MDVDCPRCGVENWLENGPRCHICEAVLRRCIDCKNYVRQKQLCSAFQIEVDLQEAEKPTSLAISATCQSYSPFPRVVHKAA